MLAWEFAALSAVTFVVTVVSTAIGFGSAIMLIPIFALFLPIKQAIALLSVYFIVVTCARAWLFRAHIDWRTVKLISLGAVPAALVGIALLLRTRAESIQAVLAVVILAFLVSELFGLARRFAPQVSERGKVAIGAAYGLFNGLIGTGNPITASLLIFLGFRKEAFVATMATCSILLDVLKAGILGSQGYLTLADVPLLTSLCVLGIVGTWVGRSFVHWMSAAAFKHAVLAMLLAVSTKMLFF